MKHINNNTKVRTNKKGQTNKRVWTHKKAQTLSIDLMIGIMLFMGMLVVFFGVMMFTAQPADVSSLSDEAEFLVNTLDSENFGVIEENQVSEQELQSLATKSYEEIKSDIGVGNEFCIFLEDENGEVIPIETDEGLYVYGVGSNKIEVGENMRCG